MSTETVERKIRRHLIDIFIIFITTPFPKVIYLAQIKDRTLTGVIDQIGYEQTLLWAQNEKLEPTDIQNGALKRRSIVGISELYAREISTNEI